MANYSDETIETMVAQYQASPTRGTVQLIADEIGKSPRSVIAKLSALGVYQKQERVNKAGEPIVKKEVYVSQIQDALGIEVPSAEKMTKSDLVALVNAIKAG